MKLSALSVRQPYATAILRGLKREEYRTFRTHLRGTLVIHASLTLELAGLEEYPGVLPEECWGGCLLGTVEVTDCLQRGPRDFAWVLADPRFFAEPINWTGRAGVFPVELADEQLSLLS